jgi:hypothetical protein
MTSKEVQMLVEEQIAGTWNRSNAHGIDLKACLITPQKQIFYSSANIEDQFELWIVLEEKPDDTGYKIVFDEESKEFGLATPGWNKKNCYLGSYGSFWEAFEAM